MAQNDEIKQAPESTATSTNTGECAASAATVPNTKQPEDGWHPDLNQDEAIMAQEREIEKEIAENSPLIGDKTDLGVLLKEYALTEGSFTPKIEKLLKTYGQLRRTRPDGNCFFRGLAFAYFEILMNDENELKKFIEIVEKCKKMLIDNGFSSFTIEDFHDSFIGVLKRIEAKELVTIEQLLEVFNEPGLSNYLVVYLRLITSGHLQQNAEFFQYFIEGHVSVKEFCNHEVEPMYRECDHIHVSAITEATDIPVSISYLDRTGGENVAEHTFPTNKEAKVFLLYRPGHYDILYKKAN